MRMIHIFKRFKGRFNNFLIIGVGILIVLLLIINLFTPEHVKTGNYFWYLYNKPQIVTEDVIGKTPCTESIENPEYTKFYNARKAEADKPYNECWAKNHTIRDCWLLRGIVDMTGAPDKYISVEKTCNTKTATNYWFQIFGKQLFVVKIESVKADSPDSLTLSSVFKKILQVFFYATPAYWYSHLVWGSPLFPL